MKGLTVFETFCWRYTETQQQSVFTERRSEVGLTGLYNPGGGTCCSLWIQKVRKRSDFKGVNIQNCLNQIEN